MGGSSGARSLLLDPPYLCRSRSTGMMTAADIAWYMRLHARDLRHGWITPNVNYYAWGRATCSPFLPKGMYAKWDQGQPVRPSERPPEAQAQPGHAPERLVPEKENGVQRTPSEAREERRRLAGATECRRPNYFCFAMPCSIYRRPRPMALPPYAGIYTVDDFRTRVRGAKPIQLHQERMGRTS